MIFEFEVDGTVIREENVEKETIVNFINQMKPDGNSFCILTASNESYVQCAGAKSKLTIEYRRYEGSSFGHFVLGSQKDMGKNVSVRYSGGYISVMQNEALTSKDAINVFETFFNTQCIAEGYRLRETTAMFSE
jgi:hypothetical protein